MANHRSALKRTRSNARREEVNIARRSRIRTFVKKIMTALDAKDATAAEKAFKEAQPEIQRGVTKGVTHKNTASRQLSRLSARIKALKEAK